MLIALLKPPVGANIVAPVPRPAILDLYLLALATGTDLAVLEPKSLRSGVQLSFPFMLTEVARG